jgi:MraZ protein
MPFVSFYDRVLDDKHRFQVPSEFRGELDPEGVGEWFYLCPGEHDHTLSLYPNKLWKDIAAELRSRRNQGKEAIQYEEWYYSQCCRLDMDAQGRVVLPKWQLDQAELGKEITLAGANDHIEIWRTPDYRAFQATPPRGRPSLQEYLRTAGSGWKEPNPSSTA